MKIYRKKVVSLMLVMSFLLITGSCNSNSNANQESNIVTKQEAVGLLLSNKSVFQNAAETVKTITVSSEHDGLYFKYQNNEMVQEVRGEQVENEISNDEYNEILQAFETMNSVVNDKYSEDDYFFVIGYYPSESRSDNCDTVGFSFNEINSGNSYFLTYLKDDLTNDSNIYEKVDEMWYYYER